MGVPQDEPWGYWRTDKVRVVYTSVLRTALPQIIRGGLPIVAGPGMHWMKKTFGVTTFGVYCSDTAQAAFWYPQFKCYGGNKETLFSWLTYECRRRHSTSKRRCVLHCSRARYALSMGRKDARRFCYMPTHLCMVQIYVIGQHPLTILQGSWRMRSVFVDCLVPLDSMSLVIKFDPDHTFDDEDPNNDAQFPRIIMGWAYTQPQQWGRLEDPTSTGGRP